MASLAFFPPPKISGITVFSRDIPLKLGGENSKIGQVLSYFSKIGQIALPILRRQSLKAQFYCRFSGVFFGN